MYQSQIHLFLSLCRVARLLGYTPYENIKYPDHEASKAHGNTEFFRQISLTTYYQLFLINSNNENDIQSLFSSNYQWNTANNFLSI